VAIDNRVIKVSITIEGKINTFSGLAITAQGSKYAGSTQNSCTIKIANLKKSHRDFLSTEGTPFKRLAASPRQFVILEAGRESTGVSKVFEGDIVLVTLAQPPDIWTTIKCLTTQFQKGNIISTSEPAVSKLSIICQKAANDMGLSLNFLADDKDIANYGYTGSASKQINKIAQLADVDVYVDDNILVVKNKNSPLSQGSRVISEETGMVGIPEFTDFGVNVRFLFDTKVNVGDVIRVVSKLVPAADGEYIIYKLNFDLANRAQNFYYIAETRRPGGGVFG
jgi:hypothetical protein